MFFRVSSIKASTNLPAALADLLLASIEYPANDLATVSTNTTSTRTIASPKVPLSFLIASEYK